MGFNVLCTKHNAYPPGSRSSITASSALVLVANTMTHTMLDENNLLVLEMSMIMILILLVSLLLRSSAVGWQDGRLNLAPPSYFIFYSIITFFFLQFLLSEETI